ncbi:DUF2155 domain-containing protein [Sneathiella glossodoripedis]|uniref:DUF2155 domain-containing protein n=1 Tax=Sneathiella glossodoripedis TaxID=418853 RepID=UPI0004705EAA|nr:DUF2155 domain-containing protein [Sneathiella glossodoripedis]
MINKRVAIIPSCIKIATVFGFLFAATSSYADNLSGEAAVLRALDKVTARTEDLTIEVGETVRYGTLDITVRKCLKRPPEETPETATFLEIEENRVDEEKQSLFMGWMFASSPALNALEHPVYDVWVIDCKISAPEQSGSNE